MKLDVMKLDVSVKNLGQIKEATFNIRPMTVITGPNGTGKSFFSKSLYSILNVFSKDIYHEELNKKFRDIQLRLDSLLEEKEQKNSYIDITDEVKSKVEKLKMDLEQANQWNLFDYFALVKSKEADIQAIAKLFSNDSKLIILHENISKLQLQIANPQAYYSKLLTNQIQNELKENFQVSSISELISFEKDKSEIKVDRFLSIELSNKLIADFVDQIIGLSSVVFFESPAYWKVRDALISAKMNKSSLLSNFSRIARSFIGSSSGYSDVLDGVPKYFYDLDGLLNAKTKTEGVFKSVADLLETTLNGEFIFTGSSLNFKDKTGREISKNLMSFGMTNLGMIQALLKHNIITEGSFIFIDEPETNLHPDWQVKLAEVLLVLAQGGVNIVITTHSSDFVKALEVKIKKLHIEVMEDFLSVHFVDVDGKLLEFESTDKIQQLIEARELLSLAYQELYLSDL